jgi:integrase/recombinase XerC
MQEVAVAITNYLDSLKDVNELTKLNYFNALRNFFNWFRITNNESFEAGNVTIMDLREYLQYLTNNRTMAISTICSQIEIIRQWVFKETNYTLPPLKMPKQQRLAPKSLSRTDQNALVREVEKGRKLRDIALVRTLITTGVRVSELVRIKVNTVNIGEKSGKIEIHKGKGGKDRIVPVPHNTRQVLSRYVQQFNLGSDDFLFPSKKREGWHISERAVRYILTEYACRAHLEHVFPHALRHTTATNLLRQGVDIVAVAAIMGHESIKTTQRYTVPSEADILRVGELGDV